MLFAANKLNANMSFKSIYSEEAYAAAKKSIDLINKGDFDNALLLFNPEIKNMETGLEQLINYVINNRITEYNLIDARKNIIHQNNQKIIKEQFEFETKHAQNFGIVSIIVISKQDSVVIQNFNVRSIEKPLKEINKFFKPTMGQTRSMLLLFFVFNIVFTIYTLCHYFLNANLPKVRYLLLLSISIISINIDWNSLVLTINPLSAAFNPSQVSRSGNIGVWHMKLYLPLFSILYWLIFKEKILKHTSPKEVFKTENSN